jgi:hypothetical protein
LQQHGKQAQHVPNILEKIDGIKTLTCTIATTNILYIQEKFNPEALSFQHLVEIAEKWNAAVELIRLTDQKSPHQEIPNGEPESQKKSSRVENNGGILEDTPEIEASTDEGHGVSETVNKLIQVGRAGAAHTVYGGAQALEGRLSRTVKYSLIVVGDVFLSRGEAVRKRMKRDLISFLTDHLRVPVIGTEDLKEQYLFGPKQWLETAGYAILSVLIYLSVFTYQKPILDFLSTPGTRHRIMAAAAVALFVPVAAFIIGGLAHNILKLVKLE